MRNSFINALDNLANSDPDIFLMVGDLGYGVVDGFAKHHPDRFVNAGISEQNMTSVAAGLALQGFKVYTYSIGNFPTLRCLEQIQNDVCYHKANVKIVEVGGGLAYGQLGMSHHATEDLAIVRALPGIKVFSPADPQEAVAVLHEVNRVNGPCFVRLGKGGEPNIKDSSKICNVYHARCLNPGCVVSILGTGSILNEALKAAEELENNGIETAIYSFMSIKPIDVEQIRKCAEQSKLVVTLEEHNVVGGFGSAVAEVMVSIKQHARLLRLGLQDEYTSVVGDQNYLRKYYKIDAKSITNTILNEINCCSAW